jgi:tetratricopeptide (TPR) repeat protein
MTKTILWVCGLLFVGAIEAVANDQWRTLFDRGNSAEVTGNYAGAAAHYREAAQLAEAFDAADHRRVLSLNGLGMMYDALGRFPDADTAYRGALAVLDRAPDGGGINRAVLLSNLAALYVEMGRHERAETLLREAMAIHAVADPPDEVKLAISQNCLAELLTVTGKFLQAEPLLLASLAVLEKRPDNLTEVGIARNNLGAVRLYQGKYAAAQDVLEQSLAALEKGRGANHPIILRTLHNLALALERNKQPRAARQIWSRAVDLAANSVGLEHPLYGDILANYARHLRATGDKSKAKPLEARSAEILRDSRRRNGIGATVDAAALERGR